jgi:hypothetical protein
LTRETSEEARRGWVKLVYIQTEASTPSFDFPATSGPAARVFFPLNELGAQLEPETINGVK